METQRALQVGIEAVTLTNYTDENDAVGEGAKGHAMTVAFLEALKAHCGRDEALEIATRAFANYMTRYYTSILAETERRSQERFDKFRKHYAKYASHRSYIWIVESKTHVLQVRYERCPFHEIMVENHLGEFSHAFCMSDYSFTKAVLPGVSFHRTHEIAKGDSYCHHKWVFGEEHDEI